MKLHEIENQTFAELKANREANLKALADVPRNDLETRYLQSRQDAKQRDGKLSEQGIMLSELTHKVEALETSIEASRQLGQNLEGRLKEEVEKRKDAEALSEALRKKLAESQAEVLALKSQVQTLEAKKSKAKE